METACTGTVLLTNPKVPRAEVLSRLRESTLGNKGKGLAPRLLNSEELVGYGTHPL